MRKLFNILIISVIYLVFCGKSCVDDSERTTWQEKQVSAAKDSIRIEFEADYLSEDARYAAEVKAIQELYDLADYVEIYTDVSMDSLFREKAGDMIRTMFVNEDSKLSFGPMNHNKMKSITLGKFLGKGFGEDVLRSKVNFDSIYILEPMQKSGEKNYSGKLAANQTVKLFISSDSIISSSIPVTINFISAKHLKIIGLDTLKVWEVSLGDIDF